MSIKSNYQKVTGALEVDNLHFLFMYFVQSFLVVYIPESRPRDGDRCTAGSSTSPGGHLGDGRSQAAPVGVGGVLLDTFGSD